MRSDFLMKLIYYLFLKLFCLGKSLLAELAVLLEAQFFLKLFHCLNCLCSVCASRCNGISAPFKELLKTLNLCTLVSLFKVTSLRKLREGSAVSLLHHCSCRS